MFPVFFSRYWVRVALVTAVLFSLPVVYSEAALTKQEKSSAQTEFYYTVQKGDTLWDISKKFFDSPLQWPDLWGRNSQLPNPHLIYPGQKLHLFIKDGVLQVEVVDKSSPEKPTIAPPPDEQPFYHYALIDQIGFIRTPPVDPCGILFQSKDGKRVISARDQVFLRPLGAHTLPIGQKYTVYRALSPSENKSRAEEIGTQHYLVGVVEVTEHQPDLAVATVVKTYRNIEINDLLMPYETRSPDIFYKESKEGLEGRLTLSEEHHQLLSHQMVGFIDKGSAEGVEVGQSYILYYQESDRQSKERRLPPEVVHGAFLVLHTEPETATVLLTRSDKDISPGTAFRAEAK